MDFIWWTLFGGLHFAGPYYELRKAVLGREFV